MSSKMAILMCLFLGSRMVAFSIGTLDPQSHGYGPEVRSFLELMKHEDDELEFQIKHNEISRRDYIRSKTQIAIHRQTVLDLVKETGKDFVPEIHVVAAPDLDQLIEDGTKTVKGIKRGDTISDKWRYLGSIHRGELFYIFERMTVR